MSSVVYQTFYPYNKFDDIKTISNLNKLMLTKEVLGKLFPNEYNNPITMNCLNETSVKSYPAQRKLSQFIVPDKMDTLFWCIYISYYGEEKYLAIGNKYGNAEIAEKQKIMEALKSNKNALKNLNRKITIGLYQEIMSDLMTNAKTSLLSLVALSVYYKKNIILLNSINKTFLEYRYDDSSIANNNTESGELGSWLILKYTENKKYGFYIEEREYISDILAEYIYIQWPDKPLKGISTYKIGELCEIASKIPELNKETKLRKPDLYGKIWNHLLWI
uniref:Uncharacterized protein n=1 Tax=viral metagenome TaxID=1070528 RepID=A0A6C0JWA9_9ZZZZ